MRENYIMEGRLFTLFSRSIRVEGITTFFFYDRPVEKGDARQLAKLIKLGQQDKMDEIKKVFDL